MHCVNLEIFNELQIMKGVECIMTQNKGSTIAKNTFFLYFRFLLILFVSLYTSRFTLKALGISDFGIYQAVAGVATFFAFLSNALSTGTSRYITYELGKERPRIVELFGTLMTAHFVLAILVIVIGEPVGLWFIYDKLVIPANRFNAVLVAFQFALFSMAFQITQVPYNATIIAYERMNIYAYISIIEAFLKLIIVFILYIVDYDKLAIYSMLMFLISLIVMLIYRIYCRKISTELRFNLLFDKAIFRDVASFSSWNLLTGLASSFANQGVTIVTNMFFAPVVVTLRTLALKVNDIINQFIGNFRLAVNPQIVKSYAAQDFTGSKKLALSSTKYTYYLTLFLVLPLFLLVNPFLKLWLGEVPVGLAPFVELVLIQGLFRALDTSLYAAIYANGRIKENAIISPLFDFIQLPIVFFLFKQGCPAITLVWVETVAYIILGVVVKPIIVNRIVKYELLEIYAIILNCILVTLLASILPIVMIRFIGINSIIGTIIILLVCIVSVLISVWFIGIDKYTKKILLKKLKMLRVRIVRK